MRAGACWMRLSRFLTLMASWSMPRAAGLPRPLFMLARTPAHGPGLSRSWHRDRERPGPRHYRGGKASHGHACRGHVAEVNPRGVGLQLEGAAEVGGGVARDGHLATALRGKHRLGGGEKKRCRPRGEGHNVHGPQATPVVGGAWAIAGDPQLPGHAAGDLIEGVGASVGHGGRCDHCPHHLAVEEHLAMSRRGQRRGRRNSEKCSCGDQYCRKPGACSRSHACVSPFADDKHTYAGAGPAPGAAAARMDPHTLSSAPRRSRLGCGSAGRCAPGGTRTPASTDPQVPNALLGSRKSVRGLGLALIAGSRWFEAPGAVRSGGSPAWLPKQPTDKKTGPAALDVADLPAVRAARDAVID